MATPEEIKEVTKRIDDISDVVASACAQTWIGSEKSDVVAAALLRLAARMLHETGYSAEEFDLLSRDTYLAAACMNGDCLDSNCPLHKSKMS